MTKSYFKVRSNIGRYQTENPILITLGCTTVLAGAVAVFYILTKMFEYSFYTIFGKDIPWYLDFLGAIALSACGAANIWIWIICQIIRAAGVEIPLIP